MTRISTAYVWSDNEAALPELLSAAKQLAECVTLIAFESESAKSLGAEYGADELILLSAQPGVVMDDYVPSLAEAVRSNEAAGVILIPASRRGRCVAAKLGVALRCAVINECSQIELDDGVQAKRVVYGGLALQRERSVGSLAILTIASGQFEVVKASQASLPQIKSAVFVAPKAPLKLIGTKPRPAPTLDLASAKCVVCVGRGFAKKEDLALAFELAELVDAEVGCSRPIAEGEGWMEHERYIGVSGVTLNSDCYFALGVSGQIQHMVGAYPSKTIIAINKDKNAPIFDSADIGIVGDLYKVLPALVTGLK